MHMEQNIVGTKQQIIVTVAKPMLEQVISFSEEMFKTRIPVKVKLDFNPKRHGSIGGIRPKTGVPFMTLGVGKYLKHLEKNITAFLEEYASFENDPTIGSVSSSWQKVIMALICHEMSHVIQFYVPDHRIQEAFVANFGHQVLPFGKTHGEGFRKIYEILRRKFVNGFKYDTPYAIVSSTTVPATPKVAKPKRSVKGITMKLSKTDNGWFVHKYYDATGVLIGTMASKPGYESQGLIDGKWETLKNPNTGGRFKNHTEAKKFFLKL